MNRIELNEFDMRHWLHDREYYVLAIRCFGPTEAEKIKQQILLDQEKARVLDEVNQKVGFEIKGWQDDVDRLIQGYLKSESQEKETEKLHEEIRQLKFRLCDEQDSHSHVDCNKEIQSLKSQLEADVLVKQNLIHLETIRKLQKVIDEIKQYNGVILGNSKLESILLKTDD